MEKTNVKLEDLIRSSTGFSPYGTAKATVTLARDFINSEGTIVERTDHIKSRSPVIQINYQNPFYVIDLAFPTSVDMDLAAMNAAFWKDEEFHKMISDDSCLLTVLTLAIYPDEYHDQYCLLAVSPVFWSITAESPFERIHILRLVFNENYVFPKAIGDISGDSHLDPFEIIMQARASMGESYDSEENIPFEDYTGSSDNSTIQS